MTSVLVTGANGFIGSFLCASLVSADCQVKAAVRTKLSNEFGGEIKCVVIPSIDEKTDWQEALADVDVVVHLAARVHIMEETAVDVLQAFRTVNTEGTKNLAHQAAAAGVKRFIFLSTIKVLGESTELIEFTEDSPTAPADPYALSKWQAEQTLHKCAQATGMQVVIIRPPLVYGPGVKGNFLRLMQLIRRGIPLPLAGIKNQRSLVYVENLCDLIKICIDHPEAAGQVLLVADPEHFSTPELIDKLANALGYRSGLWFLPVSVLKIFGVLFGKQAELNRLCDSLRIDAGKTYQLFNWQPPFSATQAMAKTANDFLTGLR